MTISLIEYGGVPRQIECESFEFRCNHVSNWIKIKKSDGAEAIIKNISVIKAEQGELVESEE